MMMANYCWLGGCFTGLLCNTRYDPSIVQAWDIQPSLLLTPWKQQMPIIVGGYLTGLLEVQLLGFTEHFITYVVDVSFN